MTKDEGLNATVAAIFELDTPKIDVNRKEMIHTIIKTTVNGDTDIIDHLVVSLSTDNEPVVFGYILTNVRLIQFEINKNSEINTSSFILNKIIGGVERTLIDNGSRIDTRIKFAPNNIVVGLKYSSDNAKITGFFEKVEQAWIKGTQNA